MAQFSLEEYNQMRTSAQGDGHKIEYFKLEKGDCLVRFNIKTTDDIRFESVHAPVYGQHFEGLKGFAPVSCLNASGQNGDVCPFCRAAAKGHPVVAKSAKKVYIQMLVSHQGADGQWTAATPAVWERPTGFAQDLIKAMSMYVPSIGATLSDIVFVVSRIGTGKETRYTINYVPQFNNPALVPNDFSAFNGFKIEKHSFWVKTAEEMEQYLVNNSFPEAAKSSETVTEVAPGVSANPAAVALANGVNNSMFGGPVAQTAAPVAPTAPANAFVQQTAPTAPAAPTSGPLGTRW